MKLSKLFLAPFILSACTANNINTNIQNIQTYNTNSDSVMNLVEKYNHYGFEQVDLNQDGYISAQEMDYAPNTFKQMDQNNDGKINFSEASAANHEASNLMMKNIRSYYTNLFYQLDSDKNSSVSWSDIMNSQEFSFNISENHLNSFSSLSRNQEIKHDNFEIFMSSVLSSEIDKMNKAGRISNARNPVVLVPGYGEPGFALSLTTKSLLNRLGISAYTMPGFPHFGDIREEAEHVKRKVEELSQKAGRKVDLIGHSEGGLIARYYVKFLGGTDSTERYISVVTPHHGTYVAYLGIGEAARQMSYGSEFLKEMNAGDETPGNVKYTSIWTNTDMIVVPAKSCILEGANNVLLKNGNHQLLISRKTAQKAIEDALGE